MPFAAPVLSAAARVTGQLAIATRATVSLVRNAGAAVGNSLATKVAAPLKALLQRVTPRKMIGCFVAGTPLLTPTGSKRIEQFEPGDWVLSRDENNPEGKIEAKRVEEVFIREALILTIRVRGQEIGTTAEHPFWVRGKGWVNAGEIQVSDEFLSQDGQWVAVETIDDPGRIEWVYNLRVSDFHTYFVGCQEWGFSVWAHNACFEEYLRQIEEFTGVKLTEAQTQRLKTAWQQHDKQLLSPKDYTKHKKLWERPGFKDTVIDEWEKQTGQKWPVYTEDVKSSGSGRVLRKAGDRLDAHHVIEKSYNGPHEWWNIHPARYPDIHQGKIHGADGLVHELMPQRK